MFYGTVGEFVTGGVTFTLGGLRQAPGGPAELDRLLPSHTVSGLHQTEVLSPTLRPEAAKPDPQDSIRSPEADADWCARRPGADGGGPGSRA